MADPTSIVDNLLDTPDGDDVKSRLMALPTRGVSLEIEPEGDPVWQTQYECWTDSGGDWNSGDDIWDWDDPRARQLVDSLMDEAVQLTGDKRFTELAAKKEQLDQITFFNEVEALFIQNGYDVYNSSTRFEAYEHVEPLTCEYCKGSGLADDSQGCPWCNGEGSIRNGGARRAHLSDPSPTGVDESAMSGVCECDVEHQLIDSVCPWCKAHGRQRWNDPADGCSSQFESLDDDPSELVRQFVDDAIPKNADEAQIEQELAKRGFKKTDSGNPFGDWRYESPRGSGEHDQVMRPQGNHWQLINIGAAMPTPFCASFNWCLRQFDRDQRKLRQEGLDDPEDFVRHHVDATAAEQAANWRAVAAQQRLDYRRLARQLKTIAARVALLNSASTPQDRTDAEAGCAGILDKLAEYSCMLNQPDYPALPDESEKLDGALDTVGFCTGNSDGMHGGDAAQLREAAKILLSIA